MPTKVVRKICKQGTGMCIFLPKPWLDYLREKHGSISHVSIEVNGVLKISPIATSDSAKSKVEDSTTTPEGSE
jgi:hypothetical protein